MANRDDDDDILTGAVPEPDAEPTASERAHARTFAELVDKTLAGRTPPAMSADDRALLEVATVIRAATGGASLAPSRQHAIVEDALRQAVGGVTSASAVTPIDRGRARRWMPWTIAAASTAVAAAAVLMLWLRPRPPSVAEVSALPALPVEQTSRPADPLIGPIARDRSGDAISRIDYLFADRLDGFRERRLATRPGGKR